ncbi:MAG: type II secretion system F family protein [Pirellulaceae bacterium]
MAQLSTRQLAQLCDRAAVSLEAGIDVRRVWEKESLRGAPAQRQHAAAVSRRIGAGDSLADALADEGGFYPPLFCEMVRVGEETGRLEAVFHRLADHYQHLLQLQRTFLAGITWPLLQLVGAIGIIALFIVITGMLGVDPLGLGISGMPLLALYLLLVTMAAAAVATPIIGVQRGWFGPAPMLAAMKIPVVGSCLRMMALARMAWSLGMAIDAGMDARRSMRLAIRSTHNPYYLTHEEPVDREILAGREMHEALRSAGDYPADFVDVLETGELTGQVTESMVRLSEDYRLRSQHLLNTLTVIGGVLIFLLVALLIGGLIIMMFRNYLSMYDQFL